MSSRGERHALRCQVVRVDEIADGLAEAGAQAVFVSSPGPGRDPVDVTPQVLVGGFGPLQRQVDPQAVAFTREHERLLVHGARLALVDDLAKVRD